MQCPPDGLSQECIWERELEGCMFSEEGKEEKNAKVTQCFLQFGSLGNGDHIDRKGKSEQEHQ